MNYFKTYPSLDPIFRPYLISIFLINRLERIEPAEEALMFNEEFAEDPYLYQSDGDEDSNAEDNPRNDYPDEEDW